MTSPLARLTAILSRAAGVPDSTVLTMGGAVELELTTGDLRWLVEECSASAAQCERPKEASPSAWRPIESAPRDGTRFLAIQECCEAEIQHWHPKLGWATDNDDYRDPTEWQPLPDDPAADDGALAPHRATEAEPVSPTDELRARAESAEVNLAGAREIISEIAKQARRHQSPEPTSDEWGDGYGEIIRLAVSASRFLTEGGSTAPSDRRGKV